MNQYRKLNKSIDELIDECIDADAIAYCIQKLSLYAGKLVEMDRSDYPMPAPGQVWLVDAVGVVFIKSGFRNATQAMSEDDKEVHEADSPEKMRLWLHARSSTLLAHAWIDLVYQAFPELATDESEAVAEDDQTEIPETIELAE